MILSLLTRSNSTYISWTVFKKTGSKIFLTTRKAWTGGLSKHFQTSAKFYSLKSFSLFKSSGNNSSFCSSLFSARQNITFCQISASFEAAPIFALYNYAPTKSNTTRSNRAYKSNKQSFKTVYFHYIQMLSESIKDTRSFSLEHEVHRIKQNRKTAECTKAGHAITQMCRCTSSGSDTQFLNR